MLVGPTQDAKLTSQEGANLLGHLEGEGGGQEGEGREVSQVAIARARVAMRAKHVTDRVSLAEPG